MESSPSLEREECGLGDTKRGESRGIAVVPTTSEDCCKKGFSGTRPRCRAVGACFCSLVGDLGDSLFPNMFTLFSITIQTQRLRE
ncbi:F22G5.16 [Arabidopsis thaliana]|uniref:F22G5.16 n=1 Tax=Arabidopsis thaliana TaxID=3702 RepID=Q9LNW9_ARATH|nr:F22G5.16 [Arabidopsis thaliana]